MGNVRNIGQVSIAVSNLSRAVAFYRDILELQYIWETDGMAFFQCGEVRLMLSLPESKEFNFKPSEFGSLLQRRRYRHSLQRVNFEGSNI